MLSSFSFGFWFEPGGGDQGPGSRVDAAAAAAMQAIITLAS